MADTKVIGMRNGVLKLQGNLSYNDRELRRACLMLMGCPQATILLDLSDVPSLCSPEIQFITKMVQFARDHGKFFRVRLSKTLRTLLTQLEVDGLVEIEEIGEAKLTPPPRTPGL